MLNKKNECLDYPHVLVISHNSFSDTRNNGKTLKVFFDGWNRESLAQIYKTSEWPDTDMCNCFFRLTDKEVLKAFFNRSYSPGRKFSVPPDNSPHAENKHALIQNLFRKRIACFSIIQDVVWKAKWNKKRIVKWMEQFKPDAVFLQCSMPSIDELAAAIADKYNIPLFFEITDDYISPKLSANPFFWLYLRRYQKATKRVIEKSEVVFVIGEKMERAYRTLFGGKYYVAMNAVSFEDEINDKKEIKFPKEDYFNIVYTGNLELGRWEVILELGRAIEEEKDLKNKVKITIYSGQTPSKSIMSKFNACSVINFAGKIEGNELHVKQKSADALLHVESLKRKYTYITKYSVSTKIPEYMASKTPIIAVGPMEIASIEYIKKNNLGFVFTKLNKKNLARGIDQVLQNEKKRVWYAERAYQWAYKHHNVKTLSRDVKSYIIDSLNAKSDTP